MIEDGEQRPDAPTTPFLASLEASLTGAAPGADRSPTRLRDRHGRGRRGPDVVPRHPGQPERPTGRDRFDALLLDVVADLEARWHEHLGLLEYAVEECPTLPDDWTPERVPLASLMRGCGARPTRLVVFRRPIEHRCETRADLEALVLTVVVDQIAELLDLPPEVVDPRLEDDR